MRKLSLAPIALAAVLAVSGCQTGGQSKVHVGDTQAREHLQADLTMEDFISLADKVTNKMLSDELFLVDTPPALVVGSISNKTDDDRLRVQDLHDHIEEQLISSGMVRVRDQSSTNFKYVLRTELTSQRQYGANGQEIVNFQVTLKLSNLMGDRVGQWRSREKLVKGAKPFI